MKTKLIILSLFLSSAALVAFMTFNGQTSSSEGIKLSSDTTEEDEIIEPVIEKSLNRGVASRGIIVKENGQASELNLEDNFAGEESTATELASSPLWPLIKEYQKNSAEGNKVESLTRIMERAKEKNLFFRLKNDVLANPERYGMDHEAIVQMVSEDLQNFPKQIEHKFAFDKVFNEAEKAAFEESDAQSEYLVDAYVLYLESNTEDNTAMEKMTVALVSEFEQDKNTDFANKIVEAKNNFEVKLETASLEIK